MLWTVFVILLILWLLGFSVWHVGALIHLLLVAAVIVLIIRLVQGRPVVWTAALLRRFNAVADLRRAQTR